MSDRIDMTVMNQAMAGYVRLMLSRYTVPAFVLDDPMLELIRTTRAEIRRDEGGGGQCHTVTDWMQHEYGLGRLDVSYLGRDGEVAISGHYVCFLADGSILDATADQTGEGHDIRLLGPDDPEYGRYRPEFYPDLYPGSPDLRGELDAWIPFWTGEEDFDRERSVAVARGQGWWVEDPSVLLDYYRMQISVSEPWYAKLVRSWVDDIEDRHPGYAREAAPGL